MTMPSRRRQVGGRNGRKAVGTLFTLAVAVAVTACGTTSATTANQISESDGSSSHTQSDASVVNDAAKHVSGNITLYTSEPVEDANLYVNAFEKAYPNIHVDVYSSGTTQVMAKLMAEEKAGNVKADVLLLADAPTFEQLKDEGVLLSYKSPEASKIPSAFVDPDYDFVGTKALSTGIVYNTKLVQSPPTDWRSLLSSAAKGKVIMPSPDFSGAAAYFAGIMSRTPGFGWNYFQSLKHNGIVIGSGNGSVLTAVQSGQDAYGIIVDYMAVQAAAKGAPVKFVYPVSGLPVITEPVGILKSTQNKAAAEAFEDFILSQKGQEVGVQMGYVPLREGVKPPAGMKLSSQYKVLSANAKTLADNRNEDIKKFDEVMK
ncbi:MAG: ABC transporter substrate-binding protein [Alicyclobacillus herbarius]|uniref:ABC transporter substrate-binding protein n=1 Tax=Alicyclobacillus herbarius TaxID=122960 RepID=UPI00235767BF|nr:ABC transporter substrate-binding protein [Alicyclobacillus herbarius]MCL6632294.1 ABC transporter substrate-binding protein [Alicyclobacillus herbarius]